jgi:hypothetical protein
VNHYERLKVSPDAPPEVIRAAYRALAAKLHPDRKSSDAGPSERAHDDMAALNASYLVLMDAEARAEYDRTLKATSQHAYTSPFAGATDEPEAPPRGSARGARARAKAAAAADPDAEQDNQADQGPETRVDIDWLVAMPTPTLWYKNPRWIAAMLVATGLLVSGLTWWGVEEVERLEFDRSLAHRGASTGNAINAPVEPSAMATQAPERAAMPPLAAAPRGSAPELSAEQLSRMSDAELLAAMPQLLNDNASTQATHPTLIAPGGNAPHPLDGQPLGLKLAPLNLPPMRVTQ